MAPTVAVIGAGPLGLMALKEFKEEGFDVSCFEARATVGGVWRHSDDEYLSVAEGTTFNSSRYRSAIPDFPFDEDVDDFPTWQQMFDYFQKYAAHYNLQPHLRLNTKVTRVSRQADKWALETMPASGEPRTEYFDKVAVATGTYTKPHVPHLEGIKTFAGPTTHTLQFQGSPEYHGKRVLLIGFRASAVDVAATLKRCGAAKVYASHRNGITFLSRYDAASGAPFDLASNLTFLRVQLWCQKYAPHATAWLLDKFVARMSAKSYPNLPKSLVGLPGPSFAIAPPLILTDETWELIEAGFIETVRAVKKVTGPRSLELTDGMKLEDIDAIVYCTGYEGSVPFLENEHNPYRVEGEPPYLYRNTFPLHPDPAVRNSLVFLGHGEILYPGFAAANMISMAAAQIWAGRSQLPPLETMQEWHKSFQIYRRELLARESPELETTLHTFTQPLRDHFLWFEDASGIDLLSHFGWSRKAWAFWWRDRELYNACAYGVMSPAMFRLFDGGKRKVWDAAKEQILEDQRISKRKIEERKIRLAKDKSRVKIPTR